MSSLSCSWVYNNTALCLNICISQSVSACVFLLIIRWLDDLLFLPWPRDMFVSYLSLPAITVSVSIIVPCLVFYDFSWASLSEYFMNENHIMKLLRNSIIKRFCRYKRWYKKCECLDCCLLGLGLVLIYLLLY